MPSTEISKHRHVEPAALRKLLRGDLDWIVMKALEKDRTRRYETVHGLARDVERHLSDEPVRARPPSAGYRLKKFVRKHRVAVAATVAVLAALVVGLALTALGFARAEHERRIATAERDRAAEREPDDLARQLVSDVIGPPRSGCPISRLRGTTSAKCWKRPAFSMSRFSSRRPATRSRDARWPRFTAGWAGWHGAAARMPSLPSGGVFRSWKISRRSFRATRATAAI